MTELTITLSSHHFTVTRVTVRARSVVDKFARRFILFKKKYSRFGGRPEQISDRVFAASTADRSEYRFHMNQLEGFQDYLRLDEIPENMIEYVVRAPIPAVAVKLKIRPGWEVWPDQEGAVTYCLDDEPIRKMLSMGTGTGKSFVSMYVTAMLKVRTVYIVRATYIDKWIRDFHKSLDLEIKDLMVIRGSESLQQLLHVALNGGFPSKIVLISNRTFQNWLTLYEKFGHHTLNMGYPITPDKFFETIGAGLRWIDEVHEDFHLNFKIDLYTHIWRSVSMSATLKGDDGFVNSMYELAYPISERFQGPVGRRFISCAAVTYRFAEPDRLRSQGAQGYSHTTFEKSVMKNRQALKNYVEMIAFIARVEFIEDYREGEKMLIYAASIEFCTYLAKALAATFPEIKVNRYCGSEGDAFEDLINSPMSVTTLKSAGTNMDIPGLRVVLLTTAIKSSQSNIQGFGRLRDNLPEDRQQRFITTVCKDLPKQLSYHRERESILRDKALNQSSRDYTKLL